MDHRTQHHRRREWVLAGERIRSVRQDLVVVPVQLVRTLQHKVRRPVQGRPPDEEREGMESLRPLADPCNKVSGVTIPALARV